MNHLLPVSNKHQCPNCGIWIGNKYGFCTVEAFGIVQPSACEEAYNKYWASIRLKNDQGLNKEGGK